MNFLTEVLAKIATHILVDVVDVVVDVVDDVVVISSSSNHYYYYHPVLIPVELVGLSVATSLSSILSLTSSIASTVMLNKPLISLALLDLLSLWSSFCCE